MDLSLSCFFTYLTVRSWCAQLTIQIQESDLVLKDREVWIEWFLVLRFNGYDEMTGASARSELVWRVDFFFASRS